MVSSNEKHISRKSPRKPATTPEARERQMISLAVDLAEKQLREGTASSQIVTHYLKLATVDYQLQLEKLKQETELKRIQADNIKSVERTEVLYANAIKAMREYSGYNNDDEDL